MAAPWHWIPARPNGFPERNDDDIQFVVKINTELLRKTLEHLTVK
jgi:hypothetical protein